MGSLHLRASCSNIHHLRSKFGLLTETMTNDTQFHDLTSNGVAFAPWITDVENDHLELVSVAFSNGRVLTAIFGATANQQHIIFTFNQIGAFRFLDEGGLLELWSASSERKRPAQTTFRVRGHMWQKESPLFWILGAEDPYFSYMIVIDWDCLEVVSLEPPHIETQPCASA